MQKRLNGILAGCLLGRACYVAISAAEFRVLAAARADADPETLAQRDEPLETPLPFRQVDHATATVAGAEFQMLPFPCAGCR